MRGSGYQALKCANVQMFVFAIYFKVYSKLKPEFPGFQVLFKDWSVQVFEFQEVLTNVFWTQRAAWFYHMYM